MVLTRYSLKVYQGLEESLAFKRLGQMASGNVLGELRADFGAGRWPMYEPCTSYEPCMRPWVGAAAPHGSTRMGSCAVVPLLSHLSLLYLTLPLSLKDTEGKSGRVVVTIAEAGG